MKTVESRSRVIVPALLGAIMLGVVAWAQGCLNRDLAPLNPCLVSGSTKQISVTNVDKVDLLFMVDNSSSMEDKQKNLRLHVPQMVQALVTGMRGPNDPHPFPPAKDVHIGVVTCDMGLPGVDGIGGCMGYGEDGVFQHTPQPSPESPMCDVSYPTFLSYQAGSAVSPSPMKLEADFGCIANVGAMGCGFEQQLEAVLKGLWPAHYLDPKTGQPAANPIKFLALPSDPAEALGHGDGANAGFQRNDPTQGVSLLAIVVLSDEDDGSTPDMGLYSPSSSAPAWLEPVTVDNLNLRPLIGAANRNHLYPISRYVDGFKALRPGNEQLVVFAAITGVPLDLVNSDATKGVDFTSQSQRDAFYDRILNDPRMQNQIDPSTMPPDQTVMYTCNTSFGHATPGRRYVEVAKGIGANATIYSICENDYTPAMNNIIDIIAKQLGAVCLDRPLVRKADGLVTCNVVWELPPPGMGPTGTPTQCTDRPGLLSAPDATHAQTAANGGKICTVTQLPVVNNTVPAAGDGWYYDDFSAEVKMSCASGTQRTAYTKNAKPPTGVTVKLECLQETQTLVSNRTDLDPAFYNQQIKAPDIGTECDKNAMGKPVSGDASNQVCWVNVKTSSGPGVDKRMFCHPQLNTCVRSCSGATDCPPAWVCDTRDTTVAITKSPICVNPTCGSQ